MVTARRWGWIKGSGDEIRSRVGHGVPLQIWYSQIYQEPSQREMREDAARQQTQLFQRSSQTL
jgi:hypothetical protein